MKLPAVVQTLLCRFDHHAWSRGLRVKGFLVRRCKACPARQELHFPGGDWKAIAPVKRPRRTAAPGEHQGSRAVTPEQDGAA